MSWQTARGYCWARALRMLGERPGATFAGVLLAALALALIGCLFMAIQAVGPLQKRLPAAEVTAFVALGTAASEVKALSSRLEAIDGVARVRLIARDQAWADLQRRSGSDAFADIRANPLPDVLVVEFAPQAAPSVVEAAATAIRKQPRVESVQAEVEWYRRLAGLLQTTLTLLVPIGAVIAVLVLALLVCLVRVSIDVDPAELRLLEQIGAGTDFVRRPFIYAGTLLLGLAAAGGLGLMAGARVLANPMMAEVGRLFGVELSLAYPPWPLVVAFVAAALLLGAASGSVIVAKPAPFGSR